MRTLIVRASLALMLSLVLLLFFGAILLVMVVSAGWASLTVRKRESAGAVGLEEKFDARQICVGADTAVTAPVHHRPQDFADLDSRPRLT